MLLALILTLSIMLYLFVGGVCGRAFYLNRTAACGYHNKTSRLYGSCYDEHEAAAILFGAGWPVTLLIIAGVAATSLPEALGKRADEKKKRAARELEESRAAEIADLAHAARVQEMQNKLLKNQLPEGTDLEALMRDAHI